MIVAVFYGIIPIAGGFFSRYRWKKFRNRFDFLRLSPLLDYRRYRQLKKEGGVFRFTGEIESISDETLWVRGETLTIPVSLKKTKCFVLPIHEEEGVPEPPEQIRWNRVSTITEGAKVFIGGKIKDENDRLNFCSTKENPLMVIFYDCPDTELTSAIIRASRTRNEYWNSITPISIVIGALALIYIAASFLNRPAFRLTVISALAAAFVPILPVFPPGFLLTTFYRSMTWEARKLRAYWDLVRLPLRHLHPGQESGTLCSGEKYGYVKTDSFPQTEETIPMLLPEISGEGKKSQHYFFGVIEENSVLPKKPKDPFISFGVLPADPSTLARRYAVRSYLLEALAWLVLVTGIFINIVFIFLILFLLGVVSF